MANATHMNMLASRFGLTEQCHKGRIWEKINGDGDKITRKKDLLWMI